MPVIKLFFQPQTHWFNDQKTHAITLNLQARSGMRGTVIVLPVKVINSLKFPHSPMFNHSILPAKKKRYFKRGVGEFYRNVLLFIGIL